MIKKFLILIGIIASTCAFAQADKFSGFSVGLNTGIESNNVYLENTSTLGGNSTPLNLDATYSFVISPSSTLGVGLSYDLTNATAYKGLSGDGIIDDTSWKVKNHYSINIEPGYVFGENTLLYAKLAYHGAKSNVLTYNKTISGWGYGFGTKLHIDKNFYLKIEAQKINYGSETISSLNVTHKSTVGTIGLGYQF